MKVVLREARNEDASAVAEVLIASRQTFIPYARMAHSPSEVLTWIRNILIPSGGVTVACAPKSVVGVLATAQAERVAWVNQLYVLPSYVGIGVGSLLLAHGLSRLPRPVRLYTFQANVGAHRFYERHGFRAIALSDGSTNEEKCPDVLFELAAGAENVA